MYEKKKKSRTIKCLSKKEKKNTPKNKKKKTKQKTNKQTNNKLKLTFFFLHTEK